MATSLDMLDPQADGSTAHETIESVRATLLKMLEKEAEDSSVADLLRLFDSDGMHLIDATEFETTMRQKFGYEGSATLLQQVFDEYNTPASLKVNAQSKLPSLASLSALTLVHCARTCMRCLRTHQLRCDKDKSGRIGYDELYRFVRGRELNRVQARLSDKLIRRLTLQPTPEELGKIGAADLNWSDADGCRLEYDSHHIWTSDDLRMEIQVGAYSRRPSRLVTSFTPTSLSTTIHIAPLHYTSPPLLTPQVLLVGNEISPADWFRTWDRDNNSALSKHEFLVNAR